MPACKSCAQDVKRVNKTGQCAECWFWRRVRKYHGGCWIWKRATDTYGYGWLRWRGRVTRAHRVAWEIKHGEIPKGVCILHHCDNPPCVRPSHLFRGTRADNRADTVAKGRQAIGENNHAKLTWRQVRELRRLHATGAWSGRALGRLFGIGATTAHGILRGRWWRENASV